MNWSADDDSAASSGTAFSAKLKPRNGSIGATVARVEDMNLIGRTDFFFLPRAMKLCPRFYVHALPRSNDAKGPAELAGIKEGDYIIGVQEIDLCDPEDPWSLLQLVTYFRDMVCSDETLQLILIRPNYLNDNSETPNFQGNFSETVDSNEEEESWPYTPQFKNMTKILVEHKMVPSMLSYEAQSANLLLHQIYKRCHQWDSGTGNLSVNLTQASNGGEKCKKRSILTALPDSILSRKEKFIDFLDSLPERVESFLEGCEFNAETIDMSDLPKEYIKDDIHYDFDREVYHESEKNTDMFVELNSLRKALNVAIINMELTGFDTFYTLLVIDVESGIEWNVRKKWADFFELQEACLAIQPSLESIAFIAHSPDSLEGRIELWFYIRTLCGLLLTANLHATSFEIAKLLQNFLNVDGLLDNLKNDVMCGSRKEMIKRLKKIFEVNIWRVMRLDPLTRRVREFISMMSVSSMENGIGKQKNICRKNLESINAFIEELQDMLLSACVNPLCRTAHSICKHEFNTERTFENTISTDEIVLIAKESIRRHLESEIYLNVCMPWGYIIPPMKNPGAFIFPSKIPSLNTTGVPTSPSKVSLIDLPGVSISSSEISYMEIPCVLKSPSNPKNRQVLESFSSGKDANITSQEKYGISKEYLSPSNWQSAVYICSKIVYESLPIDKIEALVETSHAISELYIEEHPQVDTPIGADSFIPIFMYVISRVQYLCFKDETFKSELDLINLVSIMTTVCDSSMMLGEVGYLLATLDGVVSNLAEIEM